MVSPDRKKPVFKQIIRINDNFSDVVRFLANGHVKSNQPCNSLFGTHSNIYVAYLLNKFEEMPSKMLLEPLMSIIYAKLFKAIFLEQNKRRMNMTEIWVDDNIRTNKNLANFYFERFKPMNI